MKSSDDEIRTISINHGFQHGTHGCLQSNTDGYWRVINIRRALDGCTNFSTWFQEIEDQAHRSCAIELCQN